MRQQSRDRPCRPRGSNACAISSMTTLAGFVVHQLLDLQRQCRFEIGKRKYGHERHGQQQPDRWSRQAPPAMPCGRTDSCAALSLSRVSDSGNRDDGQQKCPARQTSPPAQPGQGLAAASPPANSAAPPSTGPTVNPSAKAAPIKAIPLARSFFAVQSAMKAWAVEIVAPAMPAPIRVMNSPARPAPHRGHAEHRVEERRARQTDDDDRPATKSIGQPAPDGNKHETAWPKNWTSAVPRSSRSAARRIHAFRQIARHRSAAAATPCRTPTSR